MYVCIYDKCCCMYSVTVNNVAALRDSSNFTVPCKMVVKYTGVVGRLCD